MRTLSPMSNKERCSVSAPRSNCLRQISYARAQRFYGRMLRCVVGRVGIQDADSWRHFANEPLIFFHSFFFPFFPVKGRHGVTKLYKPKSVRQNCTYNPSGVSQEGTPPTTGHHSSSWIVLIRYAGILLLSAGHRFWNVNLAEGLAVHPNVGTCCGDIFFWQIISSRTARRLHLSDPMYTSATFQLDWRYPHTSCQLPYHLLSPMSPRVPHSMVFLKSFGGSKAKNKTCETSTARPGLVQNPGRGRFVYRCMAIFRPKALPQFIS